MLAIRELSGARLEVPKAPAAGAARSGGGSNVERLVAAAVEMLQTFGGGGFSGLAAREIRKAMTESTAAQALARLHELTRPPYS